MPGRKKKKVSCKQQSRLVKWGPTNILFWNWTPRIFMGWKSFGIGFPSDWGLTAVPDGGFCSGVKEEIPGAGVMKSLMMKPEVMVHVQSFYIPQASGLTHR
jgi:hypothetical protein